MSEAEYNAALDAIEAQLARDYLARAAKLSATLSLQSIAAMVRAGDTIRTIRAFQTGDYSATIETIRAAYQRGGAEELAGISPRKLPAAPEGVRGPAASFDLRTPSTAARLETMTERILTAQREEQAQAVVATITSGTRRGDTPVEVARQLIGTPGAAGRPPTGGVAGLTGQDAQWIQNARDQLASGDPERMRAYFDRVRRDKRFDGIVQRAIDARRPVAPEDVEKIAKRYAERLLVTRAEVNASIEALEAYSAGRNQLYESLVEQGVEPERIRKRWKTRGDERVRSSHRSTNGQRRRHNDLFVLGSGARMLHPGDMTNGAGLADVARCRCRDIYEITDEVANG